MLITSVFGLGLGCCPVFNVYSGSCMNDGRHLELVWIQRSLIPPALVFICSPVIPVCPVGFQIKVVGPDSSPAANELVYLFLQTGAPVNNWTLTTDSKGMVPFSLDTSLWSEHVSLQVCSLSLSTVSLFYFISLSFFNPLTFFFSFSVFPSWSSKSLQPGCLSSTFLSL